MGKVEFSKVNAKNMRLLSNIVAHFERDTHYEIISVARKDEKWGRAICVSARIFQFS